MEYYLYASYAGRVFRRPARSRFSGPSRVAKSRHLLTFAPTHQEQMTASRRSIVSKMLANQSDEDREHVCDRNS